MALIITIGGVNRTATLVEKSLRVTQLADRFTFTAELSLVDADSDITVKAGSHLDADIITVVDGATTFFSGYVVNQDIDTWQEDGSRTLHLQCQGYGIRLNEVPVEFEEYAATADDAIIDDLFDTYLAAFDSVTHVAQLDAAMDIEFSEMTLSEIMDALCQRTGGMWYVDNTKKVHYFADEGIDAGFDLSDTPNDATSFSYLDPARKVMNCSQIINRVRVVGAEDFTTTRNDAASQAAYGIRAIIIADGSLTTTTQLEEHGDAVLAAYKDPKITYIVRTRHAGAEAGNEIDFKCAELDYNSISDGDDPLVIKELHITWPTGVPEFEMTLGVIECGTSYAGRSAATASAARKTITSPTVPLGSRGWSHDLVFSATDHNTVAWAGGGTITTAGGVASYAIDAGNTGDIAAVTYVYLDTAVSATVLQKDVSAANCVGANKILIVVCNNVVAGKNCIFQVFGGPGHTGLIVGNEVVANSIDTGHLVAAAVTTPKINDLAVTGSKMTIGGSPFADNGLLLLNPGCPLAPTSWTSLKGQKATMSGAFQTMRGAFPGTKGIVAEPGATNYIDNPSFEVNITDGWAVHFANTGVNSQSTDQARYETGCLKQVGSASRPLLTYDLSGDLALDTDYVVSVWYYCASDLDKAPQMNMVYDGANHLTNGVVTKKNGWYRIFYAFKPTVDISAAELILGFPENGTGTLYWDGVQVELDRLTTTCIGSMPWCAWAAATHNSRSTRTATTMTIPTAGNISATEGAIVIWFRSLDAYNPSAGVLWSAGNANAEFDAYVNGVGAIDYRINGATRCTVAAIGVNQDHCAVFNWDSVGDTSELFLDGVSVSTGTCGGAAPTLGTTIGIGYHPHIGVIYDLCGPVTEFAVFDDLLTADEIAEIWNLQKPMGNQVAVDSPGIYIFDGTFRIASAYTGTRIEITADEFAGYNGATKQFYLSAVDGKAYAGAGNVILDVAGAKVVVSLGAFTNLNAYQFINAAGTTISRVAARTISLVNYIEAYAMPIASYDSSSRCYAECPSGKTAYASIRATDGTNWAYATAHVDDYGTETIRVGTKDNTAFWAYDTKTRFFLPITKYDGTVAHGITDFATTNEFAVLQIAEATAGGLQVLGLKDAGGVAGLALELFGALGEPADTTKSLLGRGIVEIRAGVEDGGTGLSNPGADGNLLAIRSYGVGTKFLFDAEGEMHCDAVIGAGDDWDDYDDLQMAADLSRLSTGKPEEMVMYTKEEMEAARLFTLRTAKDGKEHAMIPLRRMLSFTMCALKQSKERHEAAATERQSLQAEVAQLKGGVE